MTTLYDLNKRIAEANAQMVIAAGRADKNAATDMERFAEASANVQRVKRFFIAKQKRVRH